MLTLKARPLRFDLAQVLIPVAVLPGLALAALHAPIALLTFGPLVVSSWLLMQRERYRLDHCEVLLCGPALELRHRGQILCGVDLRYAHRQSTPTGDVVLSESDAAFVAFGVDPPQSAYPMGEQGEPSACAWRAVRLAPQDLQLLLSALHAVPTSPPPPRDDPFAQLQALGSAGRFGEEAEILLAQHLRQIGAGAGANHRSSALASAPGRADGVLTALHELALRPDRAGQAARRVLART